MNQKMMPATTFKGRRWRGQAGSKAANGDKEVGDVALEGSFVDVGGFHELLAGPENIIR